MKSYFHKYLVLTICFVLFFNDHSVFAQTNTLYPIDLSVNITPPYTTILSEYSSTTGKFQLALRRKDLYHKTWKLHVRLTLSDFAGNKCVMYSDQLQTEPKLTMLKDLQQFIENSSNCGIISNGYLPEGGYTLTFEAVDRSFDYDVPLSQPVTQTIYFEQGKAPILIFPQNEEEIQCGTAMINFSWQMPKIIAETYKYHLEVVEVTNYTDVSYEYIFNTPERALSVTCNVPSYVWLGTSANFPNDQQTRKFAWRVVLEDPSGNPKSTYTNQGISPVYSFVYCPNKSLLLSETEDESDIVMKSKNYDEELDVLPLQSVQKNGADIFAFWNLEPDIASKYSGVSIEYQTLGKDKWSSESILYPETDNDINSLALKLDKGLTYNVRGQYFKENENHERVYGPYSDILKYPNDDEEEQEHEDCGSALPEVKDCSEGSTLSLKAGDYISCHGTPVQITEISSGPTQSGSNWKVSGEGTVSFKFIEQLKLKVKFENIEVNCNKELVQGEVLTIYDKENGFVIDFNELVGKVNDGSNGSTVENVTLKETLKNPGDLMRDGDKIKMQTADGQVVTIGEVAKVKDLNYDIEQETMSSDVNCTVYFTGANTPFDNDLHNLKNILVNYYHPFDERRTYYMPYVAVTNGNISEVTTSKNGDCQDVKYIMKLSDQEVIVLNENGGKVSVPGSNVANSTQVFAICKDQEGKYVNCGSMLISNYAMTTRELHIIPLTSGQKELIDGDGLKNYLDKIYKGLGYDYTVTVEDVLEDKEEWIKKEILEDGLKIAADDQSIWKSSTDEMKQLCTIYAQKNSEAINAQNSAYLFLVPEAEEAAYKTTSGDMPRGQSVGYIFTNVLKEKEDIYHTIAHELGHGYKLEHIFDQSTKIAQGSTTNLMDYSAGNHNDLIHFQWNNMHNENILIWPLLENDEDGMVQWREFTWIGDKWDGILYDSEENLVEDKLDFFKGIDCDNITGNLGGFRYCEKKVSIPNEIAGNCSASFSSLPKTQYMINFFEINGRSTHFILFPYKDNPNLSEYCITDYGSMSSLDSRVKAGFYFKNKESFGIISFYREKELDAILYIQLHEKDDYEKAQKEFLYWVDLFLMNSSNNDKFHWLSSYSQSLFPQKQIVMCEDFFVSFADFVNTGKRGDILPKGPIDQSYHVVPMKDDNSIIKNLLYMKGVENGSMKASSAISFSHTASFNPQITSKIGIIKCMENVSGIELELIPMQRENTAACLYRDKETNPAYSFGLISFYSEEDHIPELIVYVEIDKSLNKVDAMTLLGKWTDYFLNNGGNDLPISVVDKNKKGDNLYPHNLDTNPIFIKPYYDAKGFVGDYQFFYIKPNTTYNLDLKINESSLNVSDLKVKSSQNFINVTSQVNASEKKISITLSGAFSNVPDKNHIPYIDVTDKTGKSLYKLYVVPCKKQTYKLKTVVLNGYDSNGVETKCDFDYNDYKKVLNSIYNPINIYFDYAQSPTIINDYNFGVKKDEIYNPWNYFLNWENTYSVLIIPDDYELPGENTGGFAPININYPECNSRGSVAVALNDEHETTPAHELGHLIFGLDHPFEKNVLRDAGYKMGQDFYNLMDYGNPDRDNVIIRAYDVLHINGFEGY